MLKPVLDRQLNRTPWTCGVTKDISDVRDRVLHSTYEEAYRLCHEVSGAMSGRLAESVFREVETQLWAEIMDLCRHHGGCSLKVEIAFNVGVQAYEYSQDEEDERRAKAIEEGARPSLQGIEEALEVDGNCHLRKDIPLGITREDAEAFVRGALNGFRRIEKPQEKGSGYVK